VGSSFRLIAIGTCLTGCFPSFDGLTGAERDSAVGPVTADAKLETAATETGLDVESAATEAGIDDGSVESTVSCVIDQDAMASKNCGRCGRDCELGKCVDGDCTPYTFVSDQLPAQLALDNAYLYWTNRGNSGSVYRISRSGNGGAKLVAGAQVNPSGITVTVDKIYWLDEGTADQGGKITGSDGFVMSAALDGTALKMIGSSFKRPQSLVVDSGRVYVTEHGVNDINSGSDGDILSCAIPDCTDRRLLDSAIFPMQVQLRTGSLYWTTEPSGSDGSFGSIWQIVLSDGAKASRMFPTVKVQAYRMTFSGDSLYYTSKNFQSITRHPLGAGDPTSLHMNFEPSAVVVDDSDLFALIANDYTPGSMNTGALVRMGKEALTPDGSPPPSLKKVAVPRGGDAIIDGGRSVYFTTETSIMKLVK